MQKFLLLALAFLAICVPAVDVIEPPAADETARIEGPRRPKPPGPRARPGKPVEGGRIAPDGVTQIEIDLPRKCRKPNIASRGLGCCVFRSGEYAGHWGDLASMFDLPEKMVKAGIPGGGWPGKVDQVFAKLCPDVKYVQDTSGDPAILQAILDSGRPACVTYNGHDCHYPGPIAHMVCLVHYNHDGDGWACISDNNFVEEDQFVWMSLEEFHKRWGGPGGGWAYCLLASPPPPVPHN